MNNTIILITNEYPYGNRETFLESEIPFLSKYFKKVVVVPLKSAAIKREVPFNVIIDNRICQRPIIKVFVIIGTIFSIKLLRTLVGYGRRIKTYRQAVLLLKYIASFKVMEAYTKSLVIDHQPSLVYSYWFSPVVEAFIQMRSKCFRNLKIVCRVHGGELYEEANELGFFPFRERFIHSIDRVFAISDHGKAYLGARYNASNISVSKLGVANSPSILNSSNDSGVHFASVSNIIPVKRVGLIARAILCFCQLHPDTEFFWNHFGDGAGKDKVIEILKSADLRNLNYKFHGMVANSIVYKFYESNPVDLFVNLSLSEGVPVSIMEAISFGIPILATDVGGTAEIVQGDTGHLIPVDSTESFVCLAIEKILKSNLNRDKIKRYWSKNFNCAANYPNFCEELYQL